MRAVMSAQSPRIASPMNGEAAFEYAAQAENSDPSAIVTRIRCGDTAADAEMVERCEKNVRSALMRLIPNPADRHDLVQEVWLVALVRIRVSRSIAAFRGGLRQVADPRRPWHRRDSVQPRPSQGEGPTAGSNNAKHRATVATTTSFPLTPSGEHAPHPVRFH
jgi:hypothetical protein